MTKTVNDLFKQSKADWLEEARQAARKLLAIQYSVTIEDVLHVVPLPKYLHRNTIGSVFNQSDFKPIAYRASRRTSMHGRVIRVWTMKTDSDYEKSNAELPDNWDAIRSSASEGDATRLAMVD